MKPFIHVYLSLTVRIEKPTMRRSEDGWHLPQDSLCLVAKDKILKKKIKFLFVKSLGVDITLEKFCLRGFKISGVHVH